MNRTPQKSLELYQVYTREEVHDIFEPESKFTPQTGKWGLPGCVEIADRPGDYVFFVTLGHSEGTYEFDEGITEEGVLRWQSQPKQKLGDKLIHRWINHNEDINNIYLFFRTAKKWKGFSPPYTYLGRLKYLFHDKDRECPVHFTWQILEWDIDQETLNRMRLTLEPGTLPTGSSTPSTVFHNHLSEELPPLQRQSQTDRAIDTKSFIKVRAGDYSEKDAKNRALGELGELLVLEHEKSELIKAGRRDLAEKILHISKVIGDGAGYDIKSYQPSGGIKYIEVKTTQGPKNSNFFLTSNELSFSDSNPEQYYLYRVFEYNKDTNSAQFFMLRGPLSQRLSLSPILYRIEGFVDNILV